MTLHTITEAQNRISNFKRETTPLSPLPAPSPLFHPHPPSNSICRNDVSQGTSGVPVPSISKRPMQRRFIALASHIRLVWLPSLGGVRADICSRKYQTPMAYLFNQRFLHFGLVLRLVRTPTTAISDSVAYSDEPLTTLTGTITARNAQLSAPHSPSSSLGQVRKTLPEMLLPELHRTLGPHVSTTPEFNGARPNAGGTTAEACTNANTLFVHTIHSSPDDPKSRYPK